MPCGPRLLQSARDTICRVLKLWKFFSELFFFLYSSILRNACMQECGNLLLAYHFSRILLSFFEIFEFLNFMNEWMNIRSKEVFCMLFLQIFDFCHLRIHLSYPSISTRLLYCLCFPRQPNTDRNLPSPLSKCSRNDLKSLVFEEFFKIPTLCQFAIQRCSVVEKEGRSVGGDHQMGIRRACETTRIDLNLEIFFHSDRNSFHFHSLCFFFSF